MRLLPLSLVSGLLLAASSASAVTVLSVTGVAAQCNSTGGNAGNLATGIVAAKTWTQTQGYANVSISAALDDLNTFPVPFPNFTVYLTTSDGPGTTTAQEIAHATVMAPLVAPWTTSLTTLFTGLTLPPGTYFLTIFGDPAGPALGPSCWTYSNSPVITADSGVSNIRDLQVLGVAAYPPASAFHSLSTNQLIQVTGNAIAPPTLSKAFGQVSVGAMSSVALSFTLKNPERKPDARWAAVLRYLASRLGDFHAQRTYRGLWRRNDYGSGRNADIEPERSDARRGRELHLFGECHQQRNGAGPVTNTTSTVSSNEAAPGAAASATLFLGNPFQFSYAANLSMGESYIDIANTGAGGASLLGPGFGGGDRQHLRKRVRV